MAHELGRSAAFDGRERRYRGTIVSLFQRLADLLSQQAPGVVGPLRGEQRYCFWNGVEREVGADRSDQANAHVSSFSQLLLQKFTQLRGAARFFRSLGKNVLVEEALFGERTQQAERLIPHIDGVRDTAVSKAQQRQS